VLDLTRLLPGPMCTLHLADLGADVIKIEDTGAGDYASAPLRDMVNRNKRGMRLDLKHPAGRAALLDLCGDAPDPQRSAVVFRDEDAHWRGQSQRVGAQRRGDSSQRARQAPVA
jgi:hypothetical protein